MSDGRWDWIRQPITLRGLHAALLRAHGAMLWYPVKYGTLLGLIVWATFCFLRYRVVGDAWLTVMPIIGTATAYAWVVLLADELLQLFPLTRPVMQSVRTLKWMLYAVVGVYAVMALGLWANSLGQYPVERLAGKIQGIRPAHLGVMQFEAIVLEGLAPSATQTILRSTPDSWDLYPAEEVELTVQRGTLGLMRVLDVHRDNERYYLRMLKVAPDAHVALEGLVRLYTARSRFPQAVEWDAVLRGRYPDEFEVTMQLGKSLTEAKQYGMAVSVFRKAIAVSRTYEALYALGYALAWDGKRDEASRVLTEATQLDPTDWRAFYSLGYVYSGLKRYPEARAAWSAVLELLPNFPEVEQRLRWLDSVKG
jgi:hypothetical protein